MKNRTEQLVTAIVALIIEIALFFVALTFISPPEIESLEKVSSSDLGIYASDLAKVKLNKENYQIGSILLWTDYQAKSDDNNTSVVRTNCYPITIYPDESNPYMAVIQIPEDLEDYYLGDTNNLVGTISCVPLNHEGDASNVGATLYMISAESDTSHSALGLFLLGLSVILIELDIVCFSRIRKEKRNNVKNS